VSKKTCLIKNRLRIMRLNLAVCHNRRNSLYKRAGLMTSHPKVACQNNTCMHTLNEVSGTAPGLIIYDIFHSFLCGCLLH